MNDDSFEIQKQKEFNPLNRSNGQEHLPDSFRVKYYGSYSSSAGTRVLDIIYTVKDSKIIACDGTYTAYMTDGTRVHKCELEALTDGSYNAPKRFITNSSVKRGESNEGPAYYNWTILNDKV